MNGKNCLASFDFYEQALNRSLGRKGKAQAKESKPPKEATNYSFSRHERKRQKKGRRKNSTGRKSNEAKCGLATETIDLYWQWPIPEVFEIAAGRIP